LSGNKLGELVMRVRNDHAEDRVFITVPTYYTRISVGDKRFLAQVGMQLHTMALQHYLVACVGGIEELP